MTNEETGRNKEEDARTDGFELKTKMGRRDPRPRKGGCGRRLGQLLAGLGILIVGIVIGILIAQSVPETDIASTPTSTPAVLRATVRPEPTATPKPTSTPRPTRTPTVDLNEVWGARDYQVVDIVDASFGRRVRHVIHMVAPDATTRKQRLATLMHEALRAYRQREIEDTASLRLWAGEQQVWLLAQITFAADRCGWTGEDCQRSRWSEASAGTATFTDEQLRINAYQSTIRDQFMEPILVLNEEGQPMSEAGWDCYEPIAIPDGGACYTDLGLLWEDQNERTCRQLEASWLRADEEWGQLNDSCAVDRQNRFAAAQLDLDLPVVEGNYMTMSTILYSDEDKRINMEIPRALEQRQDLRRVAPTRNATATPTRRPVPKPTATKDALGFWNDGTLHDSTLAEWRRGSYENRLATMGDFVVRLLEAEGKQPQVDFTLQDVKDYSYALVTGVDELAEDSSFGSMTISEIVATLWLLTFAEDAE